MNRHELKYLLLISFLLTLSFPPFRFGFLVPFALAGFILFIRNQSPRNCFRLGYWLGLFWGAMTLFWIAASTLPGAILTISINALHYAFIWWLFALFREKREGFALLSLPFVWVGMEYLRLFTDIRFNWLTLAYTQTYYRHFIQILDITGYYSLSFILVVFAVFIYILYSYRSKAKWILVGVMGMVIISLYLYGANRIRNYESREFPLIRAALVQPNVDPFEKWDPEFQQTAFQMLMDASREIILQRPQLIVWPETATPFYLRARISALRRIQGFLDSTGVYLLTGTPDYGYLKETQEYISYNAAFFFRPGGTGFERYYKMALVPAAESMPFKRTFPFLRKIDVGGGDFFPGTEYKVFQFTVPELRGKFEDKKYVVTKRDSSKTTEVGLSAIICYESVFPHLVRQFIREGANLLTIITNDGWFGLTNGPYQHAQYAIFRAVENRVSIIRCANTGISSFIDPTGRIIDRAGLNTRKDLVSLLPVNNQTTFYNRHGEWLGKFILLVSLTLIFIKFISWVLFERRKV